MEFELNLEEIYSTSTTSKPTGEKDYNLAEIIIALCFELVFTKCFERYQVEAGQAEEQLSRLRDLKLNFSKTWEARWQIGMPSASGSESPWFKPQ